MQQSVLGVVYSGKDLLSAVMYQINRLLFIHLPALNHLELNNIIMTNNFMTIFQVIPGMKRMMILIDSWKNES